MGKAKKKSVSTATRPIPIVKPAKQNGMEIDADAAAAAAAAKKSTTQPDTQQIAAPPGDGGGEEPMTRSEELRALPTLASFARPSRRIA